MYSLSLAHSINKCSDTLKLLRGGIISKRAYLAGRGLLAEFLFFFLWTSEQSGGVYLISFSKQNGMCTLVMARTRECSLTSA